MQKETQQGLEQDRQEGVNQTICKARGYFMCVLHLAEQGAFRKQATLLPQRACMCISACTRS